MKFNVVVLDPARSDAEGIFEWIAERSDEGASHWARAYGEALLALRHKPERHALAPESYVLRITIRQKLFKTRRGRPYRLVYSIVGNEVRVLRVRGPGQAPVTSEDLAE